MTAVEGREAGLLLGPVAVGLGRIVEQFAHILQRCPGFQAVG